MKTTSHCHMSQGNKKPRVSRFRLWAGLCIWSLLLAMAYVVWQAQDNAYWTSGWDGKTSVKAIVIAIICAYLFFFVLSYGIVRAWRNLPAIYAKKGN